MKDNIVLLVLIFLKISRSKFGEYKEYHTSVDNLKIISNKSLNNSLKVLKTIVDAFETGLYPEVQIKESRN